MIDLGWLIGNIIIIVASIIVLGIAVALIRNDEPAAALGTFAGVVFIGGGLLLFNNFPFDMEYHSYRPVSGVVDSTNSRFMTNGSSGTSQKFAIRFQGSDQIYGCNDTRCSLAEKGDKLALKCERIWQYASVGGYDCRYAQ